jgi:hypothetical protein
VVGFGVSNTGTGPSNEVTADVVLPPGVSYVGVENSGAGFLNSGFSAGRLLLAPALDGWQCSATDDGASCVHPGLAPAAATSAYLDVTADPGSQGDTPVTVTVSSDGVTPVTVTGARGVQARGLAARYAATGPLKVTEVGNALLSCPIAQDGCAQARQRLGKLQDDDNWQMTGYDGDTDPTTSMSSGATLSLPAGATVQWAGLYWSGAWNKASQQTLKLRAPGAATYTTIAADRVDTTPSTQYTAMQAYADVTAAVQAGGAGDWWAADPQVPLGTGKYAGWSLVVVTSAPGAPTDQVTVFDGLQTVDATTGPLSFSVASRPGGPARIGSVVWEGDTLAFGDSLALNSTTLTEQGGTKNPNDFADSSSNGAIGPPLTFGTDVDSFLTDFPAGIPVLTAKSTGETIFVGVVTVSGG